MRFIRFLLLLTLILGLAFCAASPKAKRLPPEKDPQYQYQKGVIAYNYGLEEEALRYARQAIALDPGHYLSWNLLGLVQSKKKIWEEAEAAFAKAVELKPDFAEGLANLAAVHQELKAWDKAEAAFRKSFEIDRNADAALGLANISLRNKRIEEALAFVGQALVKAPRRAAAYNLQGVILNQAGRYTEAAASFQGALKLAPDDPYILVNLGIAYMNNNEFPKAREALERALPRLQDPALVKQVREYLERMKGGGRS